MALIPIYSYDKCKGNNTRYIIQLYDYTEIEQNSQVYYTVCCMLGENNELYDQPLIVRLITDVIKTSPIVGNLPSECVSNLIRKSYRRDNKWQREAVNRINDIIISFENMPM